MRAERVHTQLTTPRTAPLPFPPKMSTLLTLHNTSAPQPLATLLSPAHLLSNLWRHRDLIRQFTLRTFLQRHRGTQLGVLWSILLPLTLLSVYTFVFGTIFKTTTFGEHTAQNTLHFASILFCGMALYSIFAESVIRSPTLILENPNFVKKVVFPVEILPIASLGSALLTGLISLALVILGTLLSTHTLPWTAILLPVVLLPLLTLALGLAWFLAALGVFLRDIGNVVSILVGQILFFLTPILYHPKLLKEYEWMSTINPLTAIIDGGRSVLLFGEQPDWRALALTFVASLAFMQLAYAFFMKSKRGFGDVL